MMQEEKTKAKRRYKRRTEEEKIILNHCHNIYSRLKEILDLDINQLKVMQDRINKLQIEIDNNPDIDKEIKLKELTNLQALWKGCQRCISYQISKKNDRLHNLNELPKIEQEIDRIKHSIDVGEVEIDEGYDRIKELRKKHKEISKYLYLKSENYEYVGEAEEDIPLEEEDDKKEDEEEEEEEGYDYESEYEY